MIDFEEWHEIEFRFQNNPIYEKSDVEAAFNAGRPKWISVEDRLPEYTSHAGSNEFAHVLACASGMIGDAMYCNGVWEFLQIPASNYITHWMPLPEPPTVNEDPQPPSQ